MTRKEEITKKIDCLEDELYRVDSLYNIATRQVDVYLDKKIKLNEQINNLKEELQELESENLIAPLNSAITALQNYCNSRPDDCVNCLLDNICSKEPYKWEKIK